MKANAVLALAGLLLAVPVAAQTAGSAQAQAGASAQAEAKAPKAQAKAGTNTSAQAGSSSATVAEGTVFEAALAKPIDAGKCKPGDPVEARVTKDVKSEGKTVIPRGSKLLGRVTEAKARSKNESESALGIAFDRARLKDGREVPLQTTIQAVAAAQSAASASAMDTQAGAMGSAAGAGSVATSQPRPSGGNAGGGLVGGVASTASSAVGATTGAAGGVAQGAGGAVGGTVGSAASAGGSAGRGGLVGDLNSSTTGVFGLRDLTLASQATSATQGSLITSPTRNVKLESGTRLLLRTVATASASR